MVWPRRLAWAAALLAGTLLLVGVGLLFLAPTRSAWLTLMVGVATVPLAAGLGLLITRHRPELPVGALLSLVGLAVSATVTREIAWQVLDARPDVARRLDWLVAVLNEGAWWVLVAVALLLVYFPDGHLPSRRWRWVPAVLVASAVITQVHGAFGHAPFRPPLQDLAGPFAPPPLWLDIVAEVAFAFLILLVVASSVSLAVRYRRSDPLQRRQITWLALGGFGVGLYPLLCLVEILVWGHSAWVSAAVGVTALVGVPVATAIAVLRHDLYDVDKALAGTVTWVFVTAALVCIYAVAAFSGGLFLGRDSAAVAAAATAVCALALSPVKKGLQRLVDQRLYPLRRATASAVETLHRDVGAGLASPEELEQVLRVALRDPQLRVGVRVPGSEEYVDVAGVPVHPVHGEPVVLRGKQIGVLVPGTDGVSLELLREVAGVASTMVEVVRLRLELSRALNEVESSRARLVQSGDEERRRLERDLHDGAQQRLVSLGMAIRLAQRHLDDGTVDLQGLLDECVAELGTAVAELRQIAHGLRPSNLDDGLPTALARLVRSVPVTVEMDVLTGPLPDEVATTAYFLISEAVANAVKHAEASRIGLKVSRVNGNVLVRITDDGRGGAAVRSESGLADRVAALGGSLSVASPVGQGTVVEAELPCAS
jgi:signal transduction histidine kinase